MKYSKLYYILRIASWLIVGVLAFVAYSQVGKEMVWKEKMIIENTLEMLETPRDKTADVEDNTKKKDSKNKNKKKKKGNYIVKYVEIPIAVVECGFLSNEEEEKQLLNDDYQNKLAWGIYNGIIDYFYNE